MRTIAVIAIALGFAGTADAQKQKEPETRGHETIIIRDHAPGWKAPEPVKDPRIAPKYSDAAIERDAWTRAWLYLDIDEQGVVQRVKFLNKPGYDLEKIALDRIFATKFTPARSGTGKAESARIVFGIEWPSYWWLVKTQGVVTRIPAVNGIRCRGTGPWQMERIHRVYRDCSAPDMTKIPTESWIARPAR
jgi:hypothetical protein